MDDRGAIALLRQGLLRRATVIAALLGGALWTITGLAVLLGGRRPPHLYELAPVPLALAAVGVALLSGRSRAISVASAGVLANSIAAAGHLAGSSSIVFNMALGAGMAAMLIALAMSGVHVARAGMLGRWSPLPLAIGVTTFPLLVAGGALAAAEERLMELPVALLGAAWIALGGAVGRAERG